MMSVHYGSRAHRGEGSRPRPAAAGFSEPIAYIHQGLITPVGSGVVFTAREDACPPGAGLSQMLEN